MFKSHVVGWGSDAPTPAQLKEFFDQVASGRITKQVMQNILRSGQIVSCVPDRARKILSKNFFGIEEAIKYFGVNPTKQQLVFLAEVPFTESVLEECKDSYILVAVFPLSMLDIRGKVERKLFFSHENAWYNKQAFARDRGEAGWHLVRKDIVPNSTIKTWFEQQALLAKNEEVPTAQVMTYTIIGHYLATGERLFEHVWARTSDVGPDGAHVRLGGFDEDGLNINDWYDYYRYSSIGLASARKS